MDEEKIGSRGQDFMRVSWENKKNRTRIGDAGVLNFFCNFFFVKFCVIINFYPQEYLFLYSFI